MRKVLQMLDNCRVGVLVSMQRWAKHGVVDGGEGDVSEIHFARA